MKRKALLCVVLVLLSACDAPPAPPESFAGLGSDAADFAQVVPGKVFSFPEDHGPHAGFRIEWWYVTANLKDAQGQEFGVQWTLFRNALKAGPSQAGWQDSTIWLGHAAVTSATSPQSHTKPRCSPNTCAHSIAEKASRVKAA
mgnify:CR=1 FL=1